MKVACVTAYLLCDWTFELFLLAKVLGLDDYGPSLFSSGPTQSLWLFSHLSAVNSVFTPQEVDSLKGLLGGTINVEVDSTPGADLQKVLSEIRDQYEEVMEKNRQEAEALHKAQVRKMWQSTMIVKELMLKKVGSICYKTTLSNEGLLGVQKSHARKIDF